MSKLIRRQKGISQRIDQWSKKNKVIKKDIQLREIARILITYHRHWKTDCGVKEVLEFSHERPLFRTDAARPKDVVEKTY